MIRGTISAGSNFGVGRSREPKYPAARKRPFCGLRAAPELLAPSDIRCTSCYTLPVLGTRAVFRDFADRVASLCHRGREDPDDRTDAARARRFMRLPFARDVYCFSWAAAETRGKDRANFSPTVRTLFVTPLTSRPPPSSCSSTIVSCRGNELISPVAEHLSLLPVFLTLLLNWRSGFSRRARVVGFTSFALRFVDLGLFLLSLVCTARDRSLHEDSGDEFRSTCANNIIVLC